MWEATINKGPSIKVITVICHSISSSWSGRLMYYTIWLPREHFSRGGTPHHPHPPMHTTFLPFSQASEDRGHVWERKHTHTHDTLFKIASQWPHLNTLPQHILLSTTLPVSITVKASEFHGWWGTNPSRAILINVLIQHYIYKDSAFALQPHSH